MVNYGDKIDELEDKWLYSALQKHRPEAQQYGAYTRDSTGAEDVTLERLDQLASNAHSTLENVLQLNAMTRKATITNPFVGKTIESLWANCNTDYRLTYPDAEGRNKKKLLDKSKLVIEDFLNQILIRDLIRDAVLMSYSEGNRHYYLRVDGNNYTVARLPFGIVYTSDYTVNGRPASEISIKKLEDGLKKTYQTSRKRKPIWMKDVEDDIQQNYPYIYQQWKDGETVARLDTTYAKAIRVNNFGRKFGISPLVKVLKDVVVLDNLAKADVVTSKMKQRTILLQTLRKEVIEGGKKGIAQAEYAHISLMAALGTQSSVYTGAGFVEDVRYVQPKPDDTSKDKSVGYTKSLLMGLGISFIDTESATATGSRISISELLKVVNSITEQLNQILNDWFLVVLENNGIPPEYCPRIHIMDSNAMDFDMRKDLSDFLFNKLSASRQTAFEVLGVADYATERSRRESENADGSDDIFIPHATAFNKTGDSKSPGRPAAKDPDDEDRQLNNKEDNNAK